MSMPSPFEYLSEYGFWIVWNPEGLRPPQYRHATEESANEEASRLARLHPGQPFFVMASVSRAFTPASLVVPLVLPKPVTEDDIPF